MTIARLECTSAPLHQSLDQLRHALIIMPERQSLPRGLLAASQLHAVLRRRDAKVHELAKTPVAVDLPQGGRCVYVMVDAGQDRFAQLSHLRKAVMLLLDERPAAVHLQVFASDEDEAARLAREALYVLWLNGTPLPARKQKPAAAVQRLLLHGSREQPEAFAGVAALARANLLTRELTALPPNQLTPASYRQKISQLAKTSGWQIKEYDFAQLRRMGAGAFCAVAQGSDAAGAEAAIVHLRYLPPARALPKKHRRVALVGKGICFDTGGHNLKPARYMAGMHEDMNGSAVALGLLQAISELALPVQVDVWLALAQNHLSPTAYRQNEIITALDGTHIEIVHTDAEGRLVLADTLTLATRASPAPDLVIDFATLTGSMLTALGNRYAGVFASSDALAAQAVAAGRQAAERMCAFPLDADYDEALESKVADVKQCTLEGEADHILAARFLQRFTHQCPWLHVDLSAANCSGGLGAVASDLSGFGVAWGIALLSAWLADRSMAENV
ncbi:MAG: leucyl aminopeptidase family protein [Sterolibacterium sp.]|nr:leucyl aminopeptidase family protein [Sterolibacterium sp.]